MQNILILTKRSFTGSLSETEEVARVETEKDVLEKPAGDDVAADASKENAAQVAEEKEQEDKVSLERKRDVRLLSSISQLGLVATQFSSVIDLLVSLIASWFCVSIGNDSG